MLTLTNEIASSRWVAIRRRAHTDSFGVRALGCSCGELGVEGAVAVGGLEVGVASDVLSVDEDVGDGALASLGLEGSLDGVAVANSIELDQLVLDSLGIEELLGRGAEATPSLRVDNDLVGRDGAVDLLLQVLGHPKFNYSLQSLLPTLK